MSNNDGPLPYTAQRINPTGAPATSPETPATRKRGATFPPVVIAILGASSAVLVALAAFVPPPVGTLLQILGFVSASLAGIGAAVPKLTVGHPVLQGGAVAVAGSVATGAAMVADGLPEGWPRVAAQGVALLGFWLAGKQASFGDTQK